MTFSNDAIVKADYHDLYYYDAIVKADYHDLCYCNVPFCCMEKNGCISAHLT